jgi:pimeloyl-ACP methyl ester carboxylesterase
LANYTTVQSVLNALYAALPVVAIAIASKQSRSARSYKPLKSLFGALLISAIAATVLNLLYALPIDAKPQAWQIIRTTYLMFGLIWVMRGMVPWSQALVRRLFKLPDAADKARRTWKTRLAYATPAVLLRLMLFPVLIAQGMTYRVKVIPSDTPRTLLGCDFEPVRFTTSDGLTISAWWIPAKRHTSRSTTQPAGWGERTVILCHGLGSNKANHLPLGRELVYAGYNLLAIDFRAHGESDGQICSFGDLERRDVLAAVGFLRTQRSANARRIALLGVSMGGAAALAAAGEETDDARAINAVAVLSTYDRFASAAESLLSSRLGSAIARPLVAAGIPLASMHAGTDPSSFAPSTAAARLSPRPLFVAHGRDDEMIPLVTGERLFAAASEPKTARWVGEWNGKQHVIRTNPAIVIDGVATPPVGPVANHNNLLYDDATLRAIRMFFDAALD